MADGEAESESVAILRTSTKAPPRDADLVATPEVQAAEQTFQQIGCAICHVPTIVTPPPDIVINGGAFTVPAALGNKIIHPFSDFLLHDVGTGDGIVQNGGQGTRNKIRTAPLWGLRTRTRLMHDGLSLTITNAIQRHAGEATGVISQYYALSDTEKNHWSSSSPGGVVVDISAIPQPPVCPSCHSTDALSRRKKRGTPACDRRIRATDGDACVRLDTITEASQRMVTFEEVEPVVYPARAKRSETGMATPSSQRAGSTSFSEQNLPARSSGWSDSKYPRAAGVW